MIVVASPASSREVARHYDELDRFYRELWGEHLHHGLFHSPQDDPQEAASRLVTLVAQLASIGPGQEVCDVGCGYGAAARQLAESHGARVTGLTLSEAQFEHARRHTPPFLPVHFARGDWLENDFPDDSFDVVVAIECLAHMADRERFFQEVARTLRPGGRVVVCAWLARESAGGLSRRFLLEPICREGALTGMGTEEECRRLMRSAGLQLTTFQDLTRRVRRTWTVSSRRLVGSLIRNPAHRKALRDRRLTNRRFALAVFRIRMAYAVGAMRYGVFAGRKV
jgi:tocopherol O-methyltransferase